ncbi:MAG: Hsp33 family molecular chaperone HslO [Castellaniella sp.]
MSNHLKRYLLAGGHMRVQAVRLEEAWQTGMAHQKTLPPVVRTLLGELTAAATLLAASLKFDGSVILQIQGDGPVALLVAECSATLSLRATATLRDNASVPADADFQSLLNAHGQGRFMLVLDPHDKSGGQQAWQGIVPLEGEGVAQALEQYMLASEQLGTRMWLAADEQTCAGLMLQRLPGHGGNVGSGTGRSDADDWETQVQLLRTVTPRELLDTDIDTLIHRLLWSQDCIALDADRPRWHCPCTRSRVADMLRMLGRDEVNDIVREQGSVQVQCHFCGKPYRFDALESSGLFTDIAGNASGRGHTLH